MQALPQRPRPAVCSFEIFAVSGLLISPSWLPSTIRPARGPGVQTPSPEGRQPRQRRQGGARASTTTSTLRDPWRGGSQGAGPGRAAHAGVEARARRGPGGRQRCALLAAGIRVRDQKLCPRGGGTVQKGSGRRRRSLSAAAATVRWPLLPGTEHAMTVSTPEPPRNYSASLGLGRPPYTEVASRGLQVWLCPPRVALSRPGRSQLTSRSASAPSHPG